MNSNTSSTGGERRDRPGFGWAGRSAALSLWIISVLLWCVLMRQSFTAMPWDDMTVAGERLQELRRPFAAAGMAAHLCGVIASMTTVPVIGVPINSTLDGMDALLAIVQMPPGIPVATVGINGAGMAVGILGSSLCLGCLFWLCLSSLTGSGWGIALRRVLAAGCWGFLPGVLVLAGTVGCLTTVIFPEAARYWGVADVASPGVQPFGVLDLADFSWWNPAWLYVRVGSIAVLSWSMAQVWETLVAEKNVWQPSFRRGSAAFCMVVTVMMLGLLGMDMLGGTGKVVLSMFPVYMIAYVLLVSLAFAVLSAVFLRRLDGGKELPWPRLGGMLTAMVLVKAYIVYSQYMITWYASIPAEMSFYNAAASSVWSGMFAAALVLQLLLPFLILLFPALRRRPSALGAVCAGVLFGSLLEACWMFGPGLGLDPSAWKAWLPLVLLLGGMALICCFSFLGALSVRRVFPES